MIQEVHHVLRYTHIIAGSLGLICFWIPVIAKKGGRLHLAAGRVFVALAWTIAVSAGISCCWALVAPIQFTGIDRELSADEVQHLTRELRFFFSLLGLLTVWFVSLLQLGLRAVRTKRNQRAIGNLPTKVGQAAAILASGAALLYGTNQCLELHEPRYIVLIVLGVVGITDSIKNYKSLTNPNPGRMDWWLLHMDCMLGLGIALHTAFFVFGGSRLWGQLPGAWALIPWILPSLIGAPAIAVWKGYYRRRFERVSTETLEESLELQGSL